MATRGLGTYVTLITLIAAAMLVSCAENTRPGPTGARGKADGYFDSARWTERLRDNSRLEATIDNGMTAVDYAADVEFLVYELQASRGDSFSVSSPYNPKTSGKNHSGVSCTSMVSDSSSKATP